MTRAQFAAALFAILAVGLLLRTLYPAADPPWRSTVGVVWHDEGAWTHNARNKALFGAWRQDEWNPVYIAPVFTAFEYASFKAFGVGVRQARLVSEIWFRCCCSPSGYGGLRDRSPRSLPARSSPPTTSMSCTTAPRSWKR